MDCDRISELPDSLLAHILSYLRLHHSIKTSVLSKRWKFLWLKVSGLELNTNFPPHGDALSQVMDRFLEFNQGLSFQKLKVLDHRLRNLLPHRLKEWIATLTDHGIQHLDVKIRDLLMPMNVHKSKTLVSLKLSYVVIETQELVLSLPCLKIMRLEQVSYMNAGPFFIETLISSCPVLEDLTLVQYNFHYTRLLSVRSQTLKIFRFLSYGSKCKTEFSVEIDAPKLEVMSFVRRRCDRIVVKNLSSIVKVHLHTDFNEELNNFETKDLKKSNDIREFQTGISSVRQMIISSQTLEVFYRYSKLGQIPKFHNMSHLEASFFGLTLEFLRVFLDNCPNLKNLTLNLWMLYIPRVELTNGNVPRCLTSTLEYVRIKNLRPEEETGTKLVNYFLENSAILKKLILSFTCYHPMANNDLIMKLFTSTKLSSNCQILVG